MTKSQCNGKAQQSLSNKKQCTHQIITLPAEIKQISLSNRLADLLQELMKRPLNTLEIRDLGIISSSQAIHSLKSKGILISTKKVNVIDRFGITHSKVSMYKYEGWTGC